MKETKSLKDETKSRIKKKTYVYENIEGVGEAFGIPTISIMYSKFTSPT
jgi:hypothetical protein